MAARWPKRLRAPGGAEGQPEADHAGGAGAVGRRAGGAGAELAGGEGEDLADGVVEGADGGEAGREGDLAQGHRGRLDEDPGGLGALGAGQGEGARAQFGEELAFDLAGGPAEAAGEPGDAFPVDDPVLDEPYGAGDGVRADVPLGRTGAGVGPAPLAGPEAGPLAGRGAGVELHVLGLGRDDRAAGPAVDPGGADGGEEHAVEAGVLRLDGPYAALGVGVHESRIADGRLAGWRENDMDVRSAGQTVRR